MQKHVPPATDEQRSVSEKSDTLLSSGNGLFDAPGFPAASSIPVIIPHTDRLRGLPSEDKIQDRDSDRNAQPQAATVWTGRETTPGTAGASRHKKKEPPKTATLPPY